ncbi:MAG: MFS transporter, partial [Acidobacteriota bacterium]|nr:MFS transporter [Acidobacteriota bacterium]
DALSARSGFTAITAAIGPVLGGWLIQHASWRWVFFINLPVAAIILALTMLRVPESRSPGTRRASLDWTGALLVTIDGWRGVRTDRTLSRRDRRPDRHRGPGRFLLRRKALAGPNAPARSLRLRNFTGANLVTLFLYMALVGVLFFFPLDLIQIQGYSATDAGAALLPFILLMFFLPRWSGGGAFFVPDGTSKEIVRNHSPTLRRRQASLGRKRRACCSNHWQSGRKSRLVDGGLDPF